MRELEEQARENAGALVHVSAPTGRGRVGRISRKIEDITALASKVRDCTLYVQTLASAISLTEDHVSKTIVALLRIDSRKLLISSKANSTRDDETSFVDLRQVATAVDLDHLVNQLANKRASSVMREAPGLYLAYLGKTLGQNLPADKVAAFVEVKATRDVHVHNWGDVDADYVRKAGKLGGSGSSTRR